MHLPKTNGKPDGITNKMPQKPAPAKLVKILPALDLPEQQTAAPTLKTTVALAILTELEEERKVTGTAPLLTCVSNHIAIDAKLLIRCLTEEGQVDRHKLQTSIRKPTAWVLDKNHSTILAQVIERLILKAHGAENGKLDQDGIENANELFNYLKCLENELLTRSERTDISISLLPTITEKYYQELLIKAFGEEQAAICNLPYEEMCAAIDEQQAHFDTPKDLVWPAEGYTGPDLP